jgi:hypothetical protein
MREDFSYYNNLEKAKLPVTLDSPVTFGGFSVGELATGLAGTLSVAYLTKGTPWIIAALPTGLAVAFLAKKNRELFVRGFVIHFLWAYGINITHKRSPMPGDFFRRGVRRFGP